MKIFLYTNSNYIVDELEKEISLKSNVVTVSSFLNLEEAVKKTLPCIIIHHLDDFPNDLETLSHLAKENSLVGLIGLSNAPDNLQGCRLLQIGYKSYLHALSNSSILKSAIESVANGNIYVYPKLMQFLVSQIPIPMQQNKNLESLTSKELEVLQLVSKGYSNALIAKDLGIAEVTVKKHIGSMFEKLHVKDRLSLALILK
jgi:DNA-binding NarL/FixJ family response regulator